MLYNEAVLEAIALYCLLMYIAGTVFIAAVLVCVYIWFFKGRANDKDS